MNRNEAMQCIDRLKEENRCLKSANEELRYRLDDMQESLDIANNEAVDQMLRICGCFEIEGARTTAAYQDLVGILISNGYAVEVTPLHNNTKMRITVKESEGEQ